MTTFVSRAQGVLLGLGCGDALGAPAEFYSPAHTRARHGGPIRDLIGGGYLDWRPGQHTDDTDMALALARSIASRGAYCPDDALAGYLQWYRSDPKGLGDTVRGALAGVAAGMSPAEATLLYHETHKRMSAGNGSLMRVAPLAIRYAYTPADLARHARTDSKLTHHDELAADTCEFFCQLLACELRGDRDYPNCSGSLADAYWADPRDAERRAAEAPGYALTALAVACCAWREFDTLEDGVIWAAGLGYDADTNAAVTGALLGARDGHEAIPARWAATLEAAETLARLACELADAANPR